MREYSGLGERGGGFLVSGGRGIWTVVTLVSDFAQQIRSSLSQIRSSSRTCQTALFQGTCRYGVVFEGVCERECAINLNRRQSINSSPR